MSYLFFAFLAAFCFAISQLISKLLSKHSIDNSDSLMAYFMVTTFTFAAFLLPFVPLKLPPLTAFSVLVPAIATFLIGYYLFFKGIFQTDASTYAPLFQLQAGLIAVLAFLFLGERFPLLSYAWLSLMIIGTMLVTYTDKVQLKQFFNLGVFFIVLMQVFHAVSNIFIGLSLEYLSPVQILFWENLVIGLLLLPFIWWRKPRLDYSVKQIWPMFLSSYVVGIGVVSLFYAFSVNLTISSVIGLLSAPIVFIVSVLASRFHPALLEHHSTKVYLVRGLGLLIILFGAYQITVG